MSTTRTTLVEHVEQNPGIHFNALVRALGTTPDKLQRLTERVESDGDLIVTDLYGKRHFYPDGYDAWERHALALVRRETTRDVLFYLLENARSDPGAVAEDVGIARSTLSWHCDRLIDAGLIEKQRDGRRVELVARRPGEIHRLLASVEPTVLEQWVDRTTRLFDRLLEGSERSERSDQE